MALHPAFAVGLALSFACGARPGARGSRCDCPETVAGHGVQRCQGGECGPCMCLPLATATEDPPPAHTFYVDADAVGGSGMPTDPWAVIDWAAVDDALDDGHVWVVFDAADTWPRRLDLLRSDDGPNRVVLLGSDRVRTGGSDWEPASGRRARVPGVHTGFDPVERSRITVRGFDVTGSADKGIWFVGGDDVLIEDNWVHDNDGSPSISIGYTADTGLISTSFVVRNNHVWAQRGECIYIGGARGEDLDAHEEIVIESNLVHDCWIGAASSKHDGINVKDRLGGVVVRGNVVFNTDWGIEAASPGEYRNNLVFDTGRNGFHITDSWGLGMGGSVIVDNAVIRAGDAAVYMNASNHIWSDVTVERFTAIESGQAALELGGAAGMSGRVDDVLLANGDVGFDAWDPVDLEIGTCVVFGNGTDADRELASVAETCRDVDPEFGDLEVPAGPDGIFFTPDDPWLSPAGGARLP